MLDVIVIAAMVHFLDATSQYSEPFSVAHEDLKPFSSSFCMIYHMDVGTEKLFGNMD